LEQNGYDDAGIGFAGGVEDEDEVEIVVCF
jgi:hypothetical protein